MSSTTAIRRAAVLVLTGAALAGAWVGRPAEVVAAPTSGSGSGPTTTQEISLRAGVQIAAKGRSTLQRRGGPVDPDPALATLPTLQHADYSGWQTRQTASAVRRMASTARTQAGAGRTGSATGKTLQHTEGESASLLGVNDTHATAEPVGAFGTGRGDRAVLDISGTIAGADVSVRTPPAVHEDNGQLSLATPTSINGVGRVQVSSVLGDGPHGDQVGDGNNDYDFYELTVHAGERITLDTAGSAVDTVVALYDAKGALLGADDDGGDQVVVDPDGVRGRTSQLTYPVTVAGTYYAFVGGHSPLGSLPSDPNDSASGPGAAKTGTYRLDIGAVPLDQDYYRLDLAAGDVIGAVVTGASSVHVVRPDGTAMVGATGSDLSGTYPAASPLPGGGRATVAYVAEAAGAYVLQVDGAPGAYGVHVEAYRPGTEGRGATRKQTILLDFDGARLDTAPFGGLGGVRTLSPLRSFMAAWGLPMSKEKELVTRITAVVDENLRRDLAAQGLNKRLALTVTSKSSGANAWGRKEVSRVVVGGTMDEAGVSTIGISSAIDPGNYSHRDSALVLLDTLSAAGTDNPGSLNTYLGPESDRMAFVSRAVGNVVSHEVGHYIGSFHTDGQDSTHTLMDEGGSNFGDNLYGVGPDGLGGTPDDEDIDFRTDAYSRLEGFVGAENTLNVSAWAFVKPS